MLRFLALPIVAGCLVLAGLSAQSEAPAAGPAPAPGARAVRGSAERVAARVIFVTRHAEKDLAGDPRDPRLSEVGTRRAQALGRLLKDAGVRQTFTSEFQRTRESAATALALPAAAARVVPAGKPAELCAALDALEPGAVALVVGHSNTVPALLAHYGWKETGADGRPVTAFPEDEYGVLFAISVPPADSNVAPTIVRLRYGD